MRRTLHLCAATSLLLLGLTACGTDDEGGDVTAAPKTTTEATQEEESTTEESAAEESTTEVTSEDPTESASDESGHPSDDESSSEDSSGSDPATAPATEVAEIWVDGTWKVEKQDEDICEMSGLSTSNYSQQDHLFTCGPTAANALACTYQDGGRTTCIVDPIGKQAIRFDSPTADDWDGEMDPREGDPIPMYVELPDGTTCLVAAHDHSKHWNQKFSWYPCEDGSELLTDESIEDTFDRDDETWTVQRSVDRKKPEETAVTRASFAGI